MDHSENLPQKREEQKPTVENEIKSKMLRALNDSIEVVHSSVLGTTFNSRQIKKTQVNAAIAVMRMAAQIDLSGAREGVTVNITNVPRPKREAIESDEA